MRPGRGRAREGPGGAGLVARRMRELHGPAATLTIAGDIGMHGVACGAAAARRVRPAAVARAAELTDYRSFPGHRVEQLIIEDGRCTGVIAYDYATGKYRKALASRGVVIATGDYSGDPDPLAYYCPAMSDNGITVMYGTRDPEGTPANTGELIKAAMWVGARVSQFQAPMIHHMGHTIEGFPDGMGIAPFMRVNKLGRRFMNEDQPGQQTENQIELQKDMCCFMIWDDKWPEELDSFPPLHGSVYHFLEEGETGTGKSRADVERSIEQGTIFRFDTLDELLGYLEETYGLDAEAAKSAVERYNELAKAGHDDDFDKLASRMFPIETPPFYASTMGRAMALVVASGLESDEDCHVFDENRDPIPGLYVAGNAQGDRFCVQYPIAMEGVDTSMSLFFGRVAGQNVVAGA